MVRMVPTIYEWAGGREAFARWLNRFYDLVELEAPGTSALFGEPAASHPRDRLAVRKDAAGFSGTPDRPIESDRAVAWQLTRPPLTADETAPGPRVTLRRE